MSVINQRSKCTCEQLELSLSYLMSRFAVNQDKQVARAVLHHLKLLVDNLSSDLDTDKGSRKIEHYLRLYNMWYVDVYGAENINTMTKDAVTNEAVIKKAVTKNVH